MGENHHDAGTGARSLGIRHIRSSPSPSRRWTASASALTIAPRRESRGSNGRFRASARALVLLIARGGADHRAACRTGQGRPAARARAHRHRQHVRGARILRQDGGGRPPADRGLRNGAGFRRPRGRPARRQRPPGAPAHRSPGRARERLPQPDAAQFARISRDAPERAARISGSLGWRARPMA